MTPIRTFIFAFAACVLMPAALVAEPAIAQNTIDQNTGSAGHITGVGGIFFKSPDPKALMAWYRDVLGIRLEPWGGAAMRYDAPGHPPAVVVNAFGQKSKYMDPSTRPFMLNFAVDNLTAFLDRLKAKGVTVLARDDSDPSGAFAWIVDPDGTKIELWEPRPESRPESRPEPIPAAK